MGAGITNGQQQNNSYRSLSTH